MELDDLSFLRTKDDLKELVDQFLQNTDEWVKYVFIDEIQEIEGWEKYINALRGNLTQDIEIIITGSNSKLLSWEFATYLSWRYLLFQIHPFSFDEYLGFLQKERSKEQLLQYLNLGGIPELYQLSDENLQYQFISALKDTIIIKDLALRYKIKDIGILQNFFSFLIGNIGNLNSLTSLSKKFSSQWMSLSVATLSTYIEYFKEIFVFHGVSRYDIKGKKFIEWEKKYYLNDVAFVHYSFSNFDQYLGKKLENFVFLSLIQKGYHVYIWNLWSLEIDFIAEKDDKKLYFQVCCYLNDEVIKREYGNLRKVNDTFPKYVISLDDVKYPTDDFWIIHLQARKLNDIL